MGGRDGKSIPDIGNSIQGTENSKHKSPKRGVGLIYSGNQGGQWV